MGASPWRHGAVVAPARNRAFVLEHGHRAVIVAAWQHQEMSGIVVVGAGVVGQVYASLLADAGYDVTIVARGQRAERLRAEGVVIEREGSRRRRACRVAPDVASAGPADTLIVAVRGDQLASVQPEVSACVAPSVVCMANPLGHREFFEQRIGARRAVFAFSGVGGFIGEDGAVHFHVVRQQPTVVDVRAPLGKDVATLFDATGLPIRRETAMSAWLATHAVFIAGIGSALLSGGGAPAVAGSHARARELVIAVSEAFDALERRGYPIRPAPLRMIFGRVPPWFAARYWQRQFAGPTVRVSIEPHVLATRESEFPEVVDFALELVGDGPSRYRRLVAAGPAT